MGAGEVMSTYASTDEALVGGGLGTRDFYVRRVSLHTVQTEVEISAAAEASPSPGPRLTGDQTILS